MKKFCFLAVAVLSFCTKIFAERPIIQDIQAFAGNSNRINLVWNLPQNPEKELTQLLVYRDLSPISSYAQLAES